jgi:biopolymer transport protein ExbB
MFEKIINNWVCWAILLVALGIYQIIWQDYLHLKKYQQVRSGYWSELSPLLTAALPLMGLLGTIVGLIETFSLLSMGLSDMLSGAIGDALFTTQLGLVCAIAAWLMQSYLGYVQRRITTQLVIKPDANVVT